MFEVCCCWLEGWKVGRSEESESEEEEEEVLAVSRVVVPRRNCGCGLGRAEGYFWQKQGGSRGIPVKEVLALCSRDRDVYEQSPQRSA